jgi:catechol 1,2-dioxygenase
MDLKTNLSTQLNQCGQKSSTVRNETQLMCDIFGIESLADEISSKLVVSGGASAPTATAILGPFYRENAPMMPNGSSIIRSSTKEYDPELAEYRGRVVDFKTGQPLAGAMIDVWLTAPNGLYEQQDSDQVDFNLRGRFVTEEDGSYEFHALRPTAYPIPEDGPTGKVLKILGRSPMRPSHTHFIVSSKPLSGFWSCGNEPIDGIMQVSAPGYKPIITQIYDGQSEYVANDSTFAVKDDLVVDFKPVQGNEKKKWELDYDFRLATFEDVEKLRVANKL